MTTWTLFWAYPLLSLSIFADNRVHQVDVESLNSRVHLEKEERQIQFSWKIRAEGRAQLQASYRILVAEKKEELKAGGHLIWDSQAVNSFQSLYVDYAGPALKPEKTYFWKVQLNNGRDEAGDWSAPAEFTYSPQKKRKSQRPSDPLPSDASQTITRSQFACSEKKLNKLFQAAVENRRVNLSVPPSFEQKEHPWGAPLQLTARAYSFEANLDDYYRGWLERFLANKKEEGFLPATESERFPDPSPGHSTAGLVVPFALWQLSGDSAWIEKAFEPAVAHLTAIQKKDVKFNGAAYGKEWGDLGHKDDPTSQEFLSICFFALNCRIMSELATAQGHMAYIMQYQIWFSNLKKGFKASFLNSNNQLKENSQTAQILALRYGLLPPEAKQKIAENLAKRLDEEGLKAGIFGQAAVLPVLSWTDHHEQAVKLAKSFAEDDAEPSEVTVATTSEWMMSFLAGFIHQAPGFKNSRVSPFIPTDGSITEVKAHHETPYGKLAIHWKTTETGLTAEVTVPPNTTSVISLPGDEKATITESGNTLEDAIGCQFMQHLNGRNEIIAQSGTYKFEVKNP